jgi:hypothetical protein
MQKAIEDWKHRTIPGERRKTTRYPLAGRAWFQWRSTDGKWHEGSGVTCDISKYGAFIATEEIPAAAAPVRLVVTLPVRWLEDAEFRLCGTGNVRHARRDSQSDGFGAFVVLHAKGRACGDQENAWMDAIGPSIDPETAK